MIDAEKMLERLRALDGYVAALAGPASLSRERFVLDADLHDLAERLLHLAVECTIDIANHTIASEGLRNAKTWRDAFLVVRRIGLVDRAD